MGNFGWETTVDEVSQAFADEIKGKTVLITGCSLGGIGAETARGIALQDPALIILAGRSIPRLQETEQQLRASFPAVPVRLLELDLGSLKQVRKAAAEVNGYEEPIDRLINNAAVSGLPYQLSEDGIELTFATNHVGPFLFTNLIMPRILAAGPGARIVNVSSIAYRFGSVRFDDVNFNDRKAYEMFAAYGQSKSANILFAAALAERLKKHGVLSYSVHPGSIWTNLYRDLSTEYIVGQGWADENRKPVKKTVNWKTLAQGAATQVLAAFDPSIEEYNGGYLEDCTIRTETLKTAKPCPLDIGNSERLWKMSEELVGQKFEY